MSKREEFEESTLYNRVNEFIKNPVWKHQEKQENEQTLFDTVNSLSDFEVTEKEDVLEYSVPTSDDTNSHLYFIIQYTEGGEIKRAKLDIGTVAAPLAGHGYSWIFETDGSIKEESPWIA